MEESTLQVSVSLTGLHHVSGVWSGTGPNSTRITTGLALLTHSRSVMPGIVLKWDLLKAVNLCILVYFLASKKSCRRSLDLNTQI
jgi:hypothetical protein